MSIATSGGSVLMTAEQLLKLPDDGWRHELIGGDLTAMAPASGPHGRVASRLDILAGHYVLQNRLGETYTADAGFLIGRDPDTVLAPDVAFIRAERVPDRRVRGYYAVVPDLVIEVVSPSDRIPQVNRKAFSWLDAGARLVWVVDPETEEIVVHRPGNLVTVLRGEDATLSGEDVIPGFSARLGAIFG